MLLARCTWAEAIRHRRVVFFVDNDSAKDCLVAGRSSSQHSRKILMEICRHELACQTWSCYSRVPSFSNPADAPSRLLFSKVWRGALRVDPVWPDLVPLGVEVPGTVGKGVLDGCQALEPLPPAAGPPG